MVFVRLRVGRRLQRDEQGAIAILTAILMVVLLGFAALVIDLGMARDSRRQSQNAADASALAAGNVLYLSGAVNVSNAISAAKSYAASNYGVTAADWAACTDDPAKQLAYHPDTACISFGPNASAPTSVRVKVPIRQVQTPFAQIWGVSSVPVSAAARIQLSPGGMAECGLCVVGAGPHDLNNGDITVSGASVAINGTLTGQNNGSITVTGTGSTIALEGGKPSKPGFTPSPLVGQVAVDDPLASLAMPDYSYLTVHANTNACPGVPGIYDHLVACGTGMTPGLYVLTGETGGNFDIVGNGVTLYFLCGTPALPLACNAGDSGGSLAFHGNGSLNITAPTTGPSKGLSIVADRKNAATFDFGGNGALTSSGTIYAPSGTLKYHGNGNGGAINSLIVVGSFDFNGNPSAFKSTYTLTANVDIPASHLHLSE